MSEGGTGPTLYGKFKQLLRSKDYIKTFKELEYFCSREHTNITEIICSSAYYDKYFKGNENFALIFMNKLYINSSLTFEKTLLINVRHFTACKKIDIANYHKNSQIEINFIDKSHLVLLTSEKNENIESITLLKCTIKITNNMPKLKELVISASNIYIYDSLPVINETLLESKYKIINNKYMNLEGTIISFEESNTVSKCEKSLIDNGDIDKQYQILCHPL